MILSGMTDKEIVREYENSGSEVVRELCNRLRENILPEDCMECEGHLDQIETLALCPADEERRADDLNDRADELESALKEIDPDHELIE